MAEWLKSIWFVDWWNATTTWQAKLWVVQSVSAKIAAVVALLAWGWLGNFIMRNGAEIIPFRVWRNDAMRDVALARPAVALLVLAVAVLLMLKLDI